MTSLPFTDMKSALIGNAFYFITIFVLMKFMENRERYNPKKFMVVYNFICVCLATYCFYGMVMDYFMQRNPLYCSSIDFDTERSKRIAHVILMQLLNNNVVRVYFLHSEVLGVY